MLGSPSTMDSMLHPAVFFARWVMGFYGTMTQLFCLQLGLRSTLGPSCSGLGVGSKVGCFSCAISQPSQASKVAAEAAEAAAQILTALAVLGSQQVMPVAPPSGGAGQMHHLGDFQAIVVMTKHQQRTQQQSSSQSNVDEILSVTCFVTLQDKAHTSLGSN